jgi:hypothetical protein
MGNTDHIGSREIQIMEHQRLQRVGLLVVVLALLAPLSSFADSRPDWRTGEDVLNYSSRGSRGDIEGTVVRVARNGDDFDLRTRRGTVRVDAKGGVRVHYRGQQYRVRDLQPGDYVAVQLRGNSRNRLRAQSVEVLDSRSRGGYGRNDRYDPWGRNDSRVSRLQGQVVSLDLRRDLLVIRTEARRDVRVYTRELDRRHGARWAQGLQRGDWVEIRGYSERDRFVATSFEVYPNRYGNRRW